MKILSLFKLWMVVSVFFLILSGGVFGKNPNRLPQGEVLRVWRKGDKAPDATAECRIGESIVIEVRDFSGWVMDALDNRRLDDERMVKDALVQKDTLVGKLISSREFHMGVAKLNSARALMEPPKGGMPWKDAWKKTADEMKSGTLKVAFQKPAAPTNSAGASGTQGLPEVSRAVSYEVTEIEAGEVFSFLGKLERELKGRLRLEVDGDMIEGLALRNAGDGEQKSRTKEGPDNSYHWMEFRLEVTPATKEFWDQVRANPTFRKALKVSLGLTSGERGLVLPTKVLPGLPGGFDFGFNLIPRGRFAAALAIWAVAALMLFALGGKTDLLRDPDGELRPDGRRCFSLGRSQMACWFLLVVGAFLFLWVVTGKYDTLNDTCLWLIGIGTGTALGAALISNPREVHARKFPVRVGHGVADSDVAEEIKKTRDEYVNGIAAGVTELEVEGQKMSRDAFSRNVEVQLKELSDTFQKKNGLQRMLDDWLMEDGLHSFHRYQMLVWTIAMALVFVVEVWKSLTMPVFNTTMLTLIGISSGTYLGFKQKSETSKK